jgi:hypothetical protein
VWVPCSPSGSLPPPPPLPLPLPLRAWAAARASANQIKFSPGLRSKVSCCRALYCCNTRHESKLNLKRTVPLAMSESQATLGRHSCHWATGPSPDSEATAAMSSRGGRLISSRSGHSRGGLIRQLVLMAKVFQPSEFRKFRLRIFED